MAIPSGEIYLLKDVPLTATYEHTIDFKDKDEQFAYFSKFVKYPLTNYTYIRKEREYISVGLPFVDLDNINYLMFRSAEGERLYFAFVTNKTYSNPDSTNIFFMLDVMQTYQFDYEWKPSYIKQAHVDRWTAEHKPIYSKTDEGLDYGSEYNIESGYKIEQSDTVRWLLVTFKDYDAIVTEGDADNDNALTMHPFPPAYNCCMVPIVNSRGSYADTPGAYTPIFYVSGSQLGGTFDNTAICDYSLLTRIMQNSAIGNYIVSISLMTYNPFVERVTQLSSGSYYIELTANAWFDFAKLGYINEDGEIEKSSEFPFLFLYSAGENVTKFSKTLAITDWDTGIENSLPTSEEWEAIKKNPRTTKRDKRFESKLLCAPYRYNLLTDWRNAPVIFKNEFMGVDKINVQFSFALSHNAPFRFWIKDYKNDPEGRYTSLSQPMAPDFPVLSDAYYTYLLENKNTIQANLTNAIVGATTGAIGSFSGGLLSGLGGMVKGALDVQAHIRSENAKQKDLQARPDTIINSNDSSFNLIDGNDCLTWYRMRICCENEEIVSEIFNISGYKVNRIDIPNTRSRVRYNYLQTVGANIVGSFNQADLLKIKEIFDKGVTIWHYTDKDFNMLDYTFENIEVNLL